MDFPSAPLERLIAGMLLAAVVAAAGWRAGALSRSGAAAAIAAGAVATAAGWDWAAILVAYFVTTSALSRLGAARKARHTGAIVAKGGTRDWRQVAANGGVFAAGAAGWALAGHPALAALALGSLAAATADSWGTEVGTLVRGEARSIVTLRRVPAGTSGGVTVAGTLATLAGAAFVATFAAALGWDARLARAAALAGVAGALVDSALGALLQARRRCPRCGLLTERVQHDCGTLTAPAGGLRWLDNDAVNLACAVTGGLLAVAFAR